jgi:hypothetical protein
MLKKRQDLLPSNINSEHGALHIVWTALAPARSGTMLSLSGPKAMRKFARDAQLLFKRGYTGLEMFVVDELR